MVNFGAYPLELTPGVNICQLIIESVDGIPQFVASRFRGQRAPHGRSSAAG